LLLGLRMDEHMTGQFYWSGILHLHRYLTTVGVRKVNMRPAPVSTTEFHSTTANREFGEGVCPCKLPSFMDIEPSAGVAGRLGPSNDILFASPESVTQHQAMPREMPAVAYCKGPQPECS
jgi:hypothetical protein